MMRRTTYTQAFSLSFAFLISACASLTSEPPLSSSHNTDQNGEHFLIVDCLLPGQVRKLGGQFTYITAKRPIKTSSSNCEIRGGEYTSYDRADYATALKIWLPLAKEGDPEAQTYVGEIYEKGLGIVPDYGLAAYWYQQAASQQFTRAQINLGHLYEQGLGVKKSMATAMEFYRMASGLTSDQLTFASSLQASYVPREQLHAVTHQLRNTEHEQQLLKKKVESFEIVLASKNNQLMANKQQLTDTQNQLQALLVSAPATASGLSTERELALLSDLKELNQQRAILESQLSSVALNERALEEQNSMLEAKLNAQQATEAQYRDQITKTQSALDEYAAKLNQAEQDVSVLSQSLETQQTTIHTATNTSQNEIALLEKKIADKNATIAHYQHQYDVLLKQREAEQQELSVLASQLKNQKQQLATQMASAQQQQQDFQQQRLQNELALNTVRQQLKNSQEQLQQRLAEKQKEIRALSDTHQVEVGDYESKIADLATQLEQQQYLVDSQNQQIVNLQNDIDDYNLEIIKIASLEPTAAGIIDSSDSIDTPPTIEIIDPPVTLTRSTPTVKVRPKQTYRGIVGKVLAPAGLLSLTINGINEELEGHSLFKVKIPIENEVTPVDIVAVDTKGRRVALSFSMLSEDNQVKKQPPTTSPVSTNNPNLGNYYALIIGNNDYQTMSTLVTAINDATEAEKILKNQYQFKTQLLINATRYQILSALNTLRETLKEEDNLLIYYAGHGKLDTVNKRGFWLPVDADENNSANWISNIAITDILNTMKAKHVLVVADSCYSGSLSQTAIARVEQELTDDVKQQWINVMANTRARIMLTSGGVEPVLDGGGGKHSIFAKAFLDTLRENNRILEGYSLYYEVLTKVMKKASQLDREQVPQYAPIHLAGHESGEFLFSPKRSL